MIPGKLKANACITFVLAMLFYLFFQISKHHPALSQVNAFAEDPYDAIGTAGVQFAVFTALLSLVRAFRPYQSKEALDGQQLLLVRGEYLTCLPVAVTLVADMIAMIRYSSLWIGFPAGHVLALLTGGMALLTVLVSWLLSSSARMIHLPSIQGRWTRVIVLSLVYILILALYQESWRQSVPGALFTAGVGTVLFFVLVWAWGTAVSPSLETPREDFIDDLLSIYRWFKAHTGRFVVFLTPFEKALGSSFLHPIVNWLNPRKHTWNAVCLCGIFVGAILALVEAMSEGGLDFHQLQHFAVLATIFIGLEGLGVLLGYSLLAKPLGLFRHISDDNKKGNMGRHCDRKR
jgi:hypothetical protein